VHWDPVYDLGARAGSGGMRDLLRELSLVLTRVVTEQPYCVLGIDENACHLEGRFGDCFCHFEA